jgi:uncharacterized membrane protein
MPGTAKHPAPELPAAVPPFDEPAIPTVDRQASAAVIHIRRRSGVPLVSIEQLSFVLACLLMGVALAAGFAEPLLAMFRTIPNDYNEGWNAFWADAAMHGRALYPAPDSDIANNYPPLSFFIVGAVGYLLGDELFAGRLVSLVSIVIVTVCIYLWLRSSGSPRRLAMFGASLFVALFVAWAPDYIGNDDPQMLAHAIMMTGLVVLWRGHLRTSSVAAAAVLMLCAGFTKHLLLPLPLATTVWLALHARRQFAVWMLAATVTALVLCGATYALYGPSFVADLLSARLYSTYRALTRTRQAIALCWPAIVLMVVTVVELWRSRDKARLADRAVVAVPYAIIAGMLGAFSAGGDGVDRNCFFDFLIGASLCAVLGLEALQAIKMRGLPGALLNMAAVCALGVLVIPLSYRVLNRLTVEEHDLQTLGAREADARETIRLIRRLGPGRAACETLSLCYWANAGFQVDFFLYGQKLLLGVLPESSCKAVFLAPQIRLVQLEKYRGEPVSGRLTASCNDVIHEHYTVLRDSASGVLLARSDP